MCVSLILYPKQWSWGQVKGTVAKEDPAGAAYASALARCSPLLAFDTWTDQKDHNNHAENVVWGYDPARLSDSALLFLDYANAMGFDKTWQAGGWKNVQRPPWMPEMNACIDSIALQHTVEKIEQFAEDSIREVVNRIPVDYLPDSEKVVIIDGLIGRRALVRQALSSELARAAP